MELSANVRSRKVMSCLRSFSMAASNLNLPSRQGNTARRSRNQKAKAHHGATESRRKIKDRWVCAGPPGKLIYLLFFSVTLYYHAQISCFLAQIRVTGRIPAPKS